MGPGIDRKKISHSKVFYVKSVCITNAFGRKNDAESEIGDLQLKGRFYAWPRKLYKASLMVIFSDSLFDPPTSQ